METFGRIELMVLLLLVSIAVALVSRRLRVPYTLALVVVGLIIGLTHLVPRFELDPEVVLFLFLPALLFEGAWNVSLRDLAAAWLPVSLFAVPGLALTIGIVAATLHFGLGLSWLVALLLGAMLSPTDPVAVLALFRQLGLPVRLRTIIEGESLFNDGVGAVAFKVVLGLLLVSLGGGVGGVESGAGETTAPVGGVWFTAAEALWLIGGGLAIGVLVGAAVDRVVRRVDDFLIETTLTFGVAYGAYLLALTVQASGLLAVVGAGLLMGGSSRNTGMTERTREASSAVWEFTGYIANSFLFLLLGLQLATSSLLEALPGIAWAVAGVLGGRALMLALFVPVNQTLAARRSHARRTTTDQVRATPTSRRSTLPQLRNGLRILRLPAPHSIPPTWRPVLFFAGLRGALSVALVLSLPANFPQRGLLEAIVYGVVLVTLVGQGTLLRLALPHWPLTQTADLSVSETPAHGMLPPPHQE